MRGPTVLITGASQGIGAELALAFAREANARLALLARSKDKLDEVARRCRELGGDAEAFPCDVSDPAAVSRTSGAVIESLGVPDVLVNNAGQFVPGSLVE
ncbi:MAG: SDR family NAD(P)-dependent oxidoreductase, partial [Rhodothermales bacterium]|nr:SDR family NAD(P)-dependent oxidoreductase [Rhodothermales bacterium]